MEPVTKTRPRTTTRFAPRGPRWAESTISRRLFEQVDASGSSPAVTDAGGTLTYDELGARACAISKALRDEGVQAGAVVALLADTSTDAVAAILGVLHAGAAFAPLDVLDPASRAAALVDLAGATHLVSSPQRNAQAADIGVSTREAVRVVDLASMPAGTRLTPPVAVAPDAPASVFFTSGSTGSPKAVLDLQRNVLHNALRYTNLLEVTPADRLSLVQRLSFSGIASSLFTALLNGATLCTYPLGADTLSSLADWVRRERITIFHSVPAVFRALTTADGTFPDVRVVRLEGDRASWAEVERFRRHFPGHAVVANGLGTTETGLVCQLRLGSREPIGSGVLPVGWAAPGVEVLVLDADGRPLAAGETGELCVRSRYLAAGYLGDDEQTASRFRADPGKGGMRVYHTGDLGRIDAAGCVELVGRVDGSFKVAGMAVEPAEVEAALLRVVGIVDAAVVVVRGPRGGGRLVASVVADPPGLDAAQIRHALASTVPAYMIPAAIEVVDELAVGAHWKLDRSARGHHGASEDPLERTLQRIWEDVLELESVGVDESFFDLGGDSLSAAEIVAAAEVEAGRPLGAAVLFEAPTVEELARLIRSEPAGRSVVTRMQSSADDGTPFFLAHDITGDVALYATLAASLPWPVYGLRQLGVLDVGFAEHAGRLAQEIRARQKRGPYRLGGHCFGAVVAFEIAHQLVDAGEEIELLALLGVTAWDFPRLAPELWQTYIGGLGVEPSWRRAARHLARARALGLRDGARQLMHAARAAPAHVRLRAGAHPRRSERDTTSQRNTEAFRAYRPRVFPGSAIVIVSKADMLGLDPQRAWRGVARHSTVGVVGDRNLDMLKPSHAPETVRLLREVVEERAEASFRANG